MTLQHWRAVAIALTFIFVGSCQTTSTRAGPIDAGDPGGAPADEAYGDEEIIVTGSRRSRDRDGAEGGRLGGLIGNVGGSLANSEDCALLDLTDAAFHCVELFFGTNRELSAAGRSIEADGPDAFGNARSFDGLVRDEREPTLPTLGGYRSGKVVVTVPRSRRPGDPVPLLGNRRANREITLDERSERFAPFSVEFMENEPYWETFGDALDGADEDSVLLFVHGFNVCFDGAAFRTAQLAYDLDFPGRAVFFSWPANCSSNFLLYGRDISLGLNSEPDLGLFIKDIHEKLQPSRLIVVAHSHGASIVARTLRDAYGRYLEAGDVDIVIFAAADANEQDFRRFASEASGLYRSATLYASQRDFATGAREVLRTMFGDTNRRVGFFFGQAPATFENVDTVDVSNGSPNILDIFGGDTRLLDYGAIELAIAHSTYAESSEIVDDMRALIDEPPDASGDQLKPDVRSPEYIEAVCVGSNQFWRLHNSPTGANRCPN